MSRLKSKRFMKRDFYLLNHGSVPAPGKMIPHRSRAFASTVRTVSLAAIVERKEVSGMVRNIVKLPKYHHKNMEKKYGSGKYIRSREEM
jgi:hypothetical protein